MANTDGLTVGRRARGNAAVARRDLIYVERHALGPDDQGALELAGVRRPRSNNLLALPAVSAALAVLDEASGAVEQVVDAPLGHLLRLKAYKRHKVRAA